MNTDPDIPRRKRIKQTSLEAYDAIKANGTLSQMRFRAYSIVRFYGPITGLELNMKGTGTQRHSLHKRLSELEALGIVEVVGNRRCRVTGRKVEEWDITDEVPASFVLEKKATRAELVDMLRRSEDLLGDGSPRKLVQQLRDNIRESLQLEE